MKTKKWFYLSLAAALVMLIATTALYADPVAPPVNQGNGDGNTWLSRGRGNGNGCGQRQRNRNRNRRSKRGNRNQGRKNFAFNYLNLTEEQREEIKVIFENHGDSLDPLRGSMQDTKWDFRAAIRADELDTDAIRDASDKMAGYRADIAIEMWEIKSEIKDILTDEQLEKLEEVKDRCIDFLEGCRLRIGQRLEMLESE